MGNVIALEFLDGCKRDGRFRALKAIYLHELLRYARAMLLLYVYDT